MATMVKEKHRGKKKAKEKHSTISTSEDRASISTAQVRDSTKKHVNEIEEVTEKSVEQASVLDNKNEEVVTEKSVEQVNLPEDLTLNTLEVENVNKALEQFTDSETINEGTPATLQATCSSHIEKFKTSSEIDNTLEVENVNKALEQFTDSETINASTSATCSTHIEKFITSSEIETYKDLNDRLKRIAIPEPSPNNSKIDVGWLENPDSYLQSKSEKLEESGSPEFTLIDTPTPSAPMCLEQTEPGAPPEKDLVQDDFKKAKECMSLDEAIRLYGGREMAAVKDLSERQEAEVTAGPNCPPDHPLIDLLSTFRSSIRAVERERNRIASNFAEEEKFRSTLWKVKKDSIHLTEQCKCGLKVDMRASYEHAELMKEKLPAAKLRLQALLKEVQESYCVHQHAAMLAHCQIEDLVAETTQVNKKNIREILSLILQALRASDGAPEALPAALQRWAEILAGALIDERDLGQLLFVMHHLFRQTRSVRWAARVIHTRVIDSVTAARTLAVLDTLLSKLPLEAAVECDEETEGAWEEMDIRGGYGAVSSGTLRERDLIALMRALPLQQLVARLVLFSHSDFRQVTVYDWGDASGGSGLLKSCCGVRALLAVLERAAAPRTYRRLLAARRALAAAALTALAALARSPRAPYLKELEDTITAELHAAFAAGFALFGTEDLDKLPTLLLTDAVAKEYCLSFIVGLHEKSRKTIESLNIEAPVLSCELRLRVSARAATERTHDHELARIVLHFLLQTGVVRKSAACKLGCESAAKECIPELLAAHPYLRALALHTVAEMAQVESLDPSTVSVLRVSAWRPIETELMAVLDEWARRCPALLHQLLLQLDYTPHTGIELPVQLHLARWLCSWSSTGAPQLEHAWRVLLRLRVHRACWRVPCVAPPPDPEPNDLFTMAHAVLTSDWGHSIPLICSQGVHAIFTLCATRPREAVHCLAPLMLLLPQSPESVSLTPKFAELFTILLSCGPNLVQRALGRGGVSGADLLLRLVLSQVDLQQPYVFPAWLHALWKVPAALSILDIAALAVRDWYVIDMYANTLIREKNAKEHLTNAVRYAFTSPLLSESLLRAAHSQEVTSNLFHSLLSALCRQRAASQRIHVDNALQKICPNISSEELVIYRCANAALVAPFQHPSHLTLWRLFFHIYLERPRDIDQRDRFWLPCGPLFFSGLIKSRTLAQIKNRLLETAIYHHNEASIYKSGPESNQPRNRVTRSESIVNDGYQNLLPALSITDLTGESIRVFEDSDSDSETGSQSFAIDGSTEEAMEFEKKRNALLASYHSGAEKMLRDYSRWLDDGEMVQAIPPNADLARYIVPQALEEAWKLTLSRCRPPPNPELDTFIRPEPPPPYNPYTAKTHLQTAVDSILSIKCRSPVSESYRSLRTIRPRVDVLDDRAFVNLHQILTRVNELLNDMENYAENWDKEVSRISCQDSKLWECVSALRVPRPLPPVKKQCANKCQPITFYLKTHEWCISAGAERGVKECRAASLASIRRLTQARPDVVRAAAGLHNIARRIRSSEHAVKVLELAWRCAGLCKPCHAAHAAIILLFDTLVERWIINDGPLCNQLLAKGCEHNSSTLQHTLCGSLVSPRGMNVADWPNVYITLLGCSLPSHTVFSYISRFDTNKWTEHISDSQRQAVLVALVEKTKRTRDEDSEAMLLELLGVHMCALITSDLLMLILMECSRFSVKEGLSLNFWKHIIRATDKHAVGCTMNEINLVLRVLGRTWSEGSGSAECERHATYAHTMAELISILVREYEAAAIKLTYLPQRVGAVVWEVLVESFSPWVKPNSILPEPLCSSHYTTMLKRFTECIRQVMRDCPGSEVTILQFAYSTTVGTYGAECARGSAPLQLSTFLLGLERLPWHDHQWYTAPHIHTLLKALSINSEELSTWAYERITATKAETLMLNCDSNHVNEHLTNCLKLFSCYKYVTDTEFLTAVGELPWWELSDAGLKEGLEFFFGSHYNLTTPYHEISQAAVILNAAELNAIAKVSLSARTKRNTLVERWATVYREPTLAGHGAGFTKFMLERITFMAPYLSSEDEKVELLRRLAALLEWGLSGADVLEMWLSWLKNAPPYISSAAVEAASYLQVTEFTAPLADNSIRLYLHLKENQWQMIRSLWNLHSRQPHEFIERGCLYAAYTSAVTHIQLGLPYTMLCKLQALVDNGIDYEKNEGIVALWICYLLRLVTECNAEILNAIEVEDATEAHPSIDATSATKSATRFATKDTTRSDSTRVVKPSSDKEVVENRFGFTIEEKESCKQVALSVLNSWGQQQRRSILKVVTLQADTERPTPRHRALVRLADCIVRPSSEAIQAYQTALSSLSGNYTDVSTWGQSANGRKLVLLATRLLPNVPDRYLQYELTFWPGE